jgi:DNA-binding IclR family transcriptional regulator
MSAEQQSPLMPREVLVYTARNGLRALEMLSFAPMTSTALGDALLMHPRSARRLLATLVHDDYAEREGGYGRRTHAYRPTMRLLALAAQAARRHPFVHAGRQAVQELHERTRASAYLAIPAYRDVLVIAASDDAPQPWTLLPATDSAAGRALLAGREHWRSVLDADDVAEDVHARGYALAALAANGTREAWVAVSVPILDRGGPIAALALRLSRAAGAPEEQPLVETLRRHAERLALRVGEDARLGSGYG